MEWILRCLRVYIEQNIRVYTVSRTPFPLTKFYPNSSHESRYILSRKSATSSRRVPSQGPGLEAQHSLTARLQPAVGLPACGHARAPPRQGIECTSPEGGTEYDSNVNIKLEIIQFFIFFIPSSYLVEIGLGF